MIVYKVNCRFPFTQALKNSHLNVAILTFFYDRWWDYSVFLLYNIQWKDAETFIQFDAVYVMIHFKGKNMKPENYYRCHASNLIVSGEQVSKIKIVRIWLIKPAWD